jgi:hypothetical protein
MPIPRLVFLRPSFCTSLNFQLTLFTQGRTSRNRQTILPTAPNADAQSGTIFLATHYVTLISTGTRQHVGDRTADDAFLSHIGAFRV